MESKALSLPLTIGLLMVEGRLTNLLFTFLQQRAMTWWHRERQRVLGKLYT
jgi:hypothetical protein